jgi:hypothetical protein
MSEYLLPLVEVLDMYYTVERVHAPCGIRKAVVFRLTYRREWRPEVQQWCDVKVSEEELGPGDIEKGCGGGFGNQDSTEHTRPSGPD